MSDTHLESPDEPTPSFRRKKLPSRMSFSGLSDLGFEESGTEISDELISDEDGVAVPSMKNYQGFSFSAATPSINSGHVAPSFRKNTV